MNLNCNFSIRHFKTFAVGKLNLCFTLPFVNNFVKYIEEMSHIGADNPSDAVLDEETEHDKTRIEDNSAANLKTVEPQFPDQLDHQNHEIKDNTSISMGQATLFQETVVENANSEIKNIKSEEEQELQKKIAPIMDPSQIEQVGDKFVKSSHSPYRHSDRYHFYTSDLEAPMQEPTPTSFDRLLVGLDSNHADLNLVIDTSHYSAEPLSEGGFAYMFAGVRATYGVVAGKIAFQMRILKQVDVDLSSDEKEKHSIRVGFSTSLTSLQLGEENFSYGYTSSGKCCTNSNFTEYGCCFEPNDVITAFLNMDNETNIEISFLKNNENLGICFTIPKEELGKDTPLFPHVLTKNCAFEVYFGQTETPFKALPVDYAEYIFLGNVPLDKRVAAPSLPDKKEDCEMIMLVGLPSSGKTTWALKYASENPEKYFTILGISSIIDKMKVDGESRLKDSSGHWEDLVHKASVCLNKVFYVATQKLGNYILDQTNISESAQERKMRKFEGYIRKAVVLMPSKEELKMRYEKQKKNHAIIAQERTFLELKAKLHLPEEGSIFSAVTFVDLGKTETEALLIKYKEEAKKELSKRYHPYHPRKERQTYLVDHSQRDSRHSFYRGSEIVHHSGYNYNKSRGLPNNRALRLPYQGRQRQVIGGHYPWYPENYRDPNLNGEYSSQQHGYPAAPQYYYSYGSRY